MGYIWPIVCLRLFGEREEEREVNICIFRARNSIKDIKGWFYYGHKIEISWNVKPSRDSCPMSQPDYPLAAVSQEPCQGRQEERERSIPPDSFLLVPYSPVWNTCIGFTIQGWLYGWCNFIFIPQSISSVLQEVWIPLTENKDFHFTVRLRIKMSAWCKTKANSHYSVVKQSVSKKKGNWPLSKASANFGRIKSIRSR